MAQIFPKSMNTVAKWGILGGPLTLGAVALFLTAFYRSSYATGAYQVVDQPVPFSHQHHVGELGIHCYYCHTSAEESAYAGIPPTETCMNCHQQIWRGNDEYLGVVRDSYKTNESIVWNKLHNLPHYVYFNHSIHVAKGVGCVECHGRVDEMPLMFQTKTLLMEWCIDCHRKPAGHLRPKDEVTSMTWEISEEKPVTLTVEENGEDVLKTFVNRQELGEALQGKYNVRHPSIITNCSICHR